MTVEDIELEKISLSDMRNPRIVFTTMTVDKKYSLLNRDNLAQPIQMQLSRKEKKFCQLCSTFCKYRLNFDHFQKKDVPHI